VAVLETGQESGAVMGDLPFQTERFNSACVGRIIVAALSGVDGRTNVDVTFQSAVLIEHGQTSVDAAVLRLGSSVAATIRILLIRFYSTVLYSRATLPTPLGTFPSPYEPHHRN
jgi:hypothetical protein